MPLDKGKLEALAISEVEYGDIVERLGREPNDLELGLFGSLWSEHCGVQAFQAAPENAPERE